MSRYTRPREIKPTIAKITATTNKITAKSLDKPATPPNPNRLAINAITANIIAQRNIVVFSLYLSFLNYRAVDQNAMCCLCLECVYSIESSQYIVTKPL